MNISYLCIFIALILTYLPKIATIFAVARLPGGYDNHHPRLQQKALTGFGSRAYAAHQNGFEVFPAFSVAVILANLTAVNPTTIAYLSIFFIVTRVIYIALYLADIATLRTITWHAGMIAVLTLFILAIF